MRVLFMGTPSFARIILSGLLQSEHDVCAVFTKQDAVSKRGNKLIPSEVKSLCLESGIDVFTPGTLKDEAVQAQIEVLNPDVICVAAYGKILPKAVLDAPKFGCINVHASLLPRWRGAAPIERGILAGDAQQGVSIMQMEEGLDTGDYCKQVAIDAVGKNAVELTEEIAEAGAGALIECLNDLETGKTVTWINQDERGVTYAEKIDKHELSLKEDDSAEVNAQRILASADSHPAKCIIDDKVVRVIEAILAEQEVAKGAVSWAGKKLILGCCEGALQVLRVKPDGKKEMDAASFVAGSPNIRSGEAAWGVL